MKDIQKHKLTCLAPLCQEDVKEDYLWYPGESVCGKVPYKKWQKTQLKLNKQAKKNPTLSDYCWNRTMLMAKKYIGKATKGVNPNRINSEKITVPNLTMFEEMTQQSRPMVYLTI